MGLRLTCARIVGAIATWGLQHIAHRPAQNFPGKLGLYIDPHLIADLRRRINAGSVVVVGTNGKTTVTNLLASSFEAAGKTVACNRTGANLDSGVATALLHTRGADWGVFECDELWLAKVLPQLQADYVVLLNLFRDQLDRVGEIDHIQASVVQALESSPATTLVYNADDPLCQAIANRVCNECIPFGIDEDLGLAPNIVADSGMCQQCDSMLAYAWRQYGQLGAYRCKTCGFHREEPAFAARDVHIAESSVTFNLTTPSGQAVRASAPFPGAYMAYNLLALHTAAICCNIAPSAVNAAVQAFEPENGRLQEYRIDGCRILLNLAKNPTGFNQNLRIITAEPRRKAAAFFINDKEADGHDVSWLWDVDFQELAAVEDLVAFAGGLRANDMQVRLKYAGVQSQIVRDAEDFLARAQGALRAQEASQAQGALRAQGSPQEQPASQDCTFYLIANYTALPAVKSQLDHLQHMPATGEAASGMDLEGSSSALDELITDLAEPTSAAKAPNAAWQDLLATEKLVIVHLYPDLLNLYGDGGNVTVLKQRAQARGIDVNVVQVRHGQTIDLAEADIVFLGGGPDREQRLASHDLMEQAGALRSYVEDDGVLLAICGGYQILGRAWIVGDEAVPGLGLADFDTRRAPGGSHNRLVGNIVLDSPLATMPVVGYENHAGRTYLGADVAPFGKVLHHHGKGNNDDDGADGVLYRNVVGTYLHGPLLAKNPEIADALIARALARRAAKKGRKVPQLPALDDAAERAANEHFRDMLHAIHGPALS